MCIRDSHGAAVGIIVGLWYYSKKVSKRSVFWILDRAVIPIALAGFFIRMGNLMNSEIIGKATDMPWGFRFIHASGISEMCIRDRLIKTENEYMQENNRRMPEITDPLYFVIDEKLNSIDLTDKGHDPITARCV